ncbi:hypothetical protein E2562_017921 [Oryza meyeriana var. granulata]|uniref:Secreted protein n=1 Tax=Oryza meyeriana var. granulata TaxID=110450 RepID=A0A6G1CSG2_9ORYZ|nr:hypothetical protein E2562_017921 [Oryza meyeriana var. granulata]
MPHLPVLCSLLTCPLSARSAASSLLASNFPRCSIWWWRNARPRWQGAQSRRLGALSSGEVVDSVARLGA